MKASTTRDSIYLKAKETLLAILQDAGIDNRERSSIISQTIASMVNGISAQALQGAIELAKDDRDSEYVLAKLCADIQLEQAQKDKIIAETAAVQMDTKVKTAQGWRLQAELHRDYGVLPDSMVYTNEELAAIDYNESYGTKAESIRLAQANVYNGYAAAYRQNGYVALDLTTDGMITSQTSADTDGLVFWQTRVAERNERGFDDNMRQHVANSSATMISMLLSTEASGIDYIPYLTSWSSAINYLNTTANETAGSITNDVLPASISIAVGVTLTGTTLNILAGTSVTIKISDGTTTSATAVGIVQLDGTWSVVVTPGMLNGLIPVASGTVTATVMDSTGALRTDIDTTQIVA